MQGGSHLLETLKSSMLFNIRTGNVILDALVTGIIIHPSGLMILASTVQDIRGRLSCLLFGGPSTCNEITISGKKLEGAHSTKCNYSTTFQAVLYQIKKLDCASSNITKLSEIQLKGDLPNFPQFDRMGQIKKDKDADTSKQREPSLIVSQNNPFKIGK